jgi:hypothetical protein
MPELIPFKSVDYLVVGHLSCDISSTGPHLGGTAAYSALTAFSLGLRVGVVTTWGGEIHLERLDGIALQVVPVQSSTSFENIYTPTGRIQYIHHVATDFSYNDVPESWRHTPIVHIGPIAGEAKSVFNGNFSSSLIGLTPQGWMRKWDGDGKVEPSPLADAQEMLSKAGAVVLSIEDVDGDEVILEQMADYCKVLAVTEGPAGARIYWNGDLRRFRAPHLFEVDATGAGDIFAAAFFWRLYVTRDPWAAARFATNLASLTVSRYGLDSIPTKDEIQTSLVEVL